MKDAALVGLSVLTRLVGIAMSSAAIFSYPLLVHPPANVNRKSSAPSFDAKNENILPTQMPTSPTAVLNGRPCSLAGSNIGIYHKVFRTFNEQFRALPSRAAFSARDLKNAAGFMATSAAYYPDEELRQAAVGPHLEHFLGNNAATGLFFHSQVGSRIQKVLPGGSKLAPTSIVSSATGGAVHTAVSITEINNGVGLGGCGPFEKAQKDFAFFALDDSVCIIHHFT